MPTYQYECDACGYSFEILQSMLDKKLKKCPECNKNELYRLIGAGTGIIFKGSGFYETDYRKKESPKSTSDAESCSSCPMAAQTEAGKGASSGGKTGKNKTDQAT